MNSQSAENMTNEEPKLVNISLASKENDDNETHELIESLLDSSPLCTGCF